VELAKECLAQPDPVLRLGHIPLHLQRLQRSDLAPVLREERERDKRDEREEEGVG
jgi:hypothetical protein